MEKKLKQQIVDSIIKDHNMHEMLKQSINDQIIKQS